MSDRGGKGHIGVETLDWQGCTNIGITKVRKGKKRMPRKANGWTFVETKAWSWGWERSVP